MQAQVESQTGARMSLSGFMAVDRTKLKAVQGEKLHELAQTDELELLYLHLQSMRNFNRIRDRLAAHDSSQPPAAAASPPDAAPELAAAAPEPVETKATDDGDNEKSSQSGGRGSRRAAAE
jgi:hypothetical protein